MPRGGYAAALAAGRGEYVRMVDADDSYPLDDLGGLVTEFSVIRIGED